MVRNHHPVKWSKWEQARMQQLTTIRDYFAATGVLFALSWLYRQTRIYFEHGLNHRAELSRTSNRFIRIVVPTNSTWAVGQHYFVRFMGLGTHAFTTHPFSACSLPSEGTKDSKYASELVLFIRPRGGFTARLAKYIDSHPNAKMRVLLDGPYGGILPGSITDNQRMLVIAGGSGAGWAFPLIMAFLKHARKLESADDTGAYPALKVVLATRELPTAEWFGKEVQQLLDATPALKVEIYLTGAHTNEEIGTPEQMASPQDDPEKGPGQGRIRVKPVLETDTPEGCLAKGVRHIQHLTSRPDLQTIVAEEARMIGENQSLSVLVCGPASMQHDVSSAVAREQLIVAKRGAGDIYLHLEHFSWA